MISIDLQGKTVLITGGTQGIGLASAQQFAMAGAKVYMTHKWGSADTEELYRAFEKLGAVKPVILEADVANDEDTDKLLDAIARQEKDIHIFISNVGFAPQVNSLEDYRKRSFFKTIEYSTWPLVEYTRRIKERFGKYPERIVGISSDGPDHFYKGYDFVAGAKALLEHFARYLSVHLLKEGSRVNVIRFGTVKTKSFEAIFGEDFFNFYRENGITEDLILKPEDCGKAVLALCSGLLNALNGQIITVDYGLPFQDNMMMHYFKSKKT
ncbi:MAG: SDR family oxidoreductase [Spirochaetota bacterium]